MRKIHSSPQTTLLFACTLLCLLRPASLLVQHSINLPGKEQRIAFIGSGAIQYYLNSILKMEYFAAHDSTLLVAMENPGPAYSKRFDAITDFPDQQTLNTFRGYDLFMQGRFTDAAAADREALADGADPSASYNLVLADIKLGTSSC